jgi:hypothetical protein
MPKPHRLWLASIHRYVNPSSGAALATRELLELLAARDWDCSSFACRVLDFAQETPLEDVLASSEHQTPRVPAALSRGGTAEVFDLELNGARIAALVAGQYQQAFETFASGEQSEQQRTLAAWTNPSHSATNCDDPRQMRRIARST